ncbi:MAG: PHP domain-containing protein [Candidatus Lokiarchaeota archaeon]|nr:PHP domain-containing protein [Candidatus Lokiarchaeota archaeon]
MIDLHLHSTESDGLDTPQELIEKANTLGLKAIALTDHDTIDGIQDFLAFGENKKIICIPGIEFSIKHEPEREIRDVHIVGLNINHNSHQLIEILKKQREGRIQQKRKICERLENELGYDISFDEVKAVAKSKTIGRPHIIEVLIKNNPEKIEGKTKDQLFKMISLGGKAYVDRKFEVTLEQSIEVIKKARGIPILAHPGIYEVSDRRKFVEFCIDAGIEGIEIEYPYNNNRPYVGTENAQWAQDVLPNFYRQIANEYNLVKSGGSDYHGGKKGIKIGEVGVPDKYLIDIL